MSVKAGDGSVLFQTGYHGPPIENDPRPADHPELTEPYIAYSPNLSVQVICQADVFALKIPFNNGWFELLKDHPP